MKASIVVASYLAVIQLSSGCVFALSHKQRNPPKAVESSLDNIFLGVPSLDHHLHHLNKRQGNHSSTGALLCAPNQPCVDGSCCNSKGVCGFGPDFCSSSTCISQCNATAMCGRYSADGSTPCGMRLCCSSMGWCGTTAEYCSNPGTPDGCQSAVGNCNIYNPKKCGTNSGTTNGRSIGYYQSANVRTRVCNTISPSQIKTDGYTHLYFAFASINPSTFEVTATDPSDISMYTEFTSLQKPGLETWIAIGGFDFSDTNTPTHQTWSQMVSTSANRAAFINSLSKFLPKYGFQGVDLDWEYPVDDSRGGSPADTQNFVHLVTEMKQAFNGKYKISVTLAPDLWYLRHFDAISMQPSLDWFGFMAYDLHGYWDAKNPALGAIVRGQTDIRDILNDAVPLWFDGLDMSKINFGLASYGRGFTLSDPSCDTLGCSYSGGNHPGQCTNTVGILSLEEIKALVNGHGITPTYLPDAMMVQIAWNDQWIGYDDAISITAKKQVANDYCFGGTMTWSIDFDSGPGSGSSPPVSTDGRCGYVGLNGAVCPDGQCCSQSGWCGSGQSYCGSGCYSGNCIIGAVTTDGTCGVGHWNSTCGGDYPGCCSAGGYCGTGDLFCGKGEQTSFSSGSSLPSGELPPKGPWYNINCNYGVLTDDGADPNQRWVDAGAADAWTWALQAAPIYLENEKRNGQPGKDFQFSQVISQLFNGVPGKQCLSVPNVPCDQSCQCDQSSDQGAHGVNCPAGYVILNSMANIHIAIDTFDTAISAANANFSDGAAGSVVEAFANFGSLEQLEFTLDVIGTVFGAIFAPAWNYLLKNVEQEILQESVKDTVLSAVAGGLVLAVNALKDANNEANLVDSFEKIAGKILAALASANLEYNAKVFGMTDHTQINNLLANGISLLPFGPSAHDVQDSIVAALVAVMIPLAWPKTTTPGYPWIMTDDGISTQPGNGCDGYRLDDAFGNSGIDARSCAFIDGHGYWLMMMYPQSQSCIDHPNSCVSKSDIGPVPGLEELEAGTFGISVTDLVTSSVKSWTLNGRKNGWPTNVIGTDNPSTLEDFAENGVRAAGVFNVPICSLGQSDQYAVSTRGWTNWPCEPPPSG